MVLIRSHTCAFSFSSGTYWFHEQKHQRHAAFAGTFSQLIEYTNSIIFRYTKAYRASDSELLCCFRNEWIRLAACAADTHTRAHTAMWMNHSNCPWCYTHHVRVHTCIQTNDSCSCCCCCCWTLITPRCDAVQSYGKHAFSFKHTRICVRRWQQKKLRWRQRLLFTHTCWLRIYTKQKKLFVQATAIAAATQSYRAGERGPIHTQSSIHRIGEYI